MIWIGVAIILLTLAAIVKRYETRLVLFLAGLAMALVAGVAIVCATLAKVSPSDIAKRTAPGMVLALISVLIFFTSRQI
jgi:C4-dicarboxylate transporter